MIFNWEFYINKYSDLELIQNREEAWEHWIKHGKRERRMFVDIPILFNWQEYMNDNLGLYFIKNEDEAWIHFLYNARKEKRSINNLGFYKQYWI